MKPIIIEEIKHFMKKTLYLIAFFFLMTNLGRSQDIPGWMTREWKNLTNGTGIWIADNSTYKSDSEPYDQYGLEWEYGLGEKSVIGSLYGIISGKKVGTFWEFRSFWDPVKNKGITLQIGPDGTFGLGEISLIDPDTVQTIQTFYTPVGKSFEIKHYSLTTKYEHNTCSYTLDKNNHWIKNRTYQWKPVHKDSVKSQVDTLPSGELMLKQKIQVNASIDKVWRAFSDAEDWKKWVTPVVEMDFRINGSIKTNYDPKAKIGDKGTIVIHILTYVPERQIVMQAELNENFPDFMKADAKNLYSIFEFNPLNENRTEVIIYGVGYKNEKKWLDLLNFFIKGNEMTLYNLKKYLE